MDIVSGACYLLAVSESMVPPLALGSKADMGLAIPPNSLVGIAAIDIGAGLGLDWKSWDWILSEGRLV